MGLDLCRVRVCGIGFGLLGCVVVLMRGLVS